MTLYSIIDSGDGHIIGSYNIKAEPEKIDKILDAVITVYGSHRTVALFLMALEVNTIKWKPIRVEGGLF